MTWSLQRLATLFVAPPASARVPVRHGGSDAGRCAAPRAPAVAVLCARDGWAAGATVALALIALHRAPCGLVCRWSAGEAAGDGPVAGGGGGAPRLPAAGRLAQRLDGAGVRARVAGRLVLVQLPTEPVQATAIAQRAAALAGAAATVLALEGRRAPGLERLIAGHDRVLVGVPAGAGAALADLALRDAARHGPPAGVLSLARAPAQRALALSGVGLGATALAAVRSALEGERR